MTTSLQTYTLKLIPLTEMGVTCKCFTFLVWQYCWQKVFICGVKDIAQLVSVWIALALAIELLNETDVIA